MIIRYWGIFSGFIVTFAVVSLVGFITFNADFSLELVFGDTPPFDAVFKGAFVWEGLWNPLYGSLRLLFFSGLFAVPMGLAVGIYASEFAGRRIRGRLVILLESAAGLPSIIVGLFGFMLILFLHKNFFPAQTGLLLASFCLAVLVLPSLALNTYTALRAVPDNLRLTAVSLGLSNFASVYKVLLPAATEGILSGLLMAAGRCAEDTAVILMTGAVASTGNATGIFDKFEALPFFIYYTSANYTDSTQLSQVFSAAFVLLAITLVFMLSGMLLTKVKPAGDRRRMLWMR